METASYLKSFKFAKLFLKNISLKMFDENLKKSNYKHSKASSLSQYKREREKLFHSRKINLRCCFVLVLGLSMLCVALEEEKEKELNERNIFGILSLWGSAGRFCSVAPKNGHRNVLTWAEMINQLRLVSATEQANLLSLRSEN